MWILPVLKGVSNESNRWRYRTCFKGGSINVEGEGCSLPKDESRYPQITNDMATIIKSGEYELFEDFDAMWKTRTNSAKNRFSKAINFLKEKDGECLVGLRDEFACFYFTCRFEGSRWCI